MQNYKYQFNHIDKTISSILKVIEAISKRQEKSERNVSEIQNVLSKKRQSETRIHGQTVNFSDRESQTNKI